MAKFSDTNQPANGEPVAKSNTKRRVMTEALMLALNEEVDNVAENGGQKTKRLRIIANKLAEKATEGDIVAIKEIFDRTEGKAAQSITMDGSLDINPLTVLLQSVDGKSKTVDGSE